MKTRFKAQQGFTLVELSIVLVIIGLIIGGVLTGQQIIQNARITNALNSIQAFQAQFQTYTQNYGALPGDDPNAVTRFSSASPPVTQRGKGDSTIEGNFDSKDTTEESYFIWSHLRAAGLVKNQNSDTGTAGQPPNPFGGVYGFQNGAFTPRAFSTTVLCLDAVPNSAAEAIDGRLDDASSNTGSVQAIAYPGDAKTGTVALKYGAADAYTLCIRI